MSTHQKTDCSRLWLFDGSCLSQLVHRSNITALEFGIHVFLRASLSLTMRSCSLIVLMNCPRFLQLTWHGHFDKVNKWPFNSITRVIGFCLSGFSGCVVLSNIRKMADTNPFLTLSLTLDLISLRSGAPQEAVGCGLVLSKMTLTKLTWSHSGSESVWCLWKQLQVALCMYMQVTWVQWYVAYLQFCRCNVLSMLLHSTLEGLF